MASLYKKPVIMRDPKTGEKLKTKSRKWWGRYKDALGREKRVPLATDKMAAQTMLNDLVRKVEREEAGLVDPFEEHAKRPLCEQIDAYQAYLRYKGNIAQYVYEVPQKIRKIAKGCRWSHTPDISASDVQRYLAGLRAGGLSVQTSNHYLRAVKQFTRWLVRDRRAKDDPLVHLSKMNPQVDRRHDRRALSPEEFARLVEAAEQGPAIVHISGPDRAMMYILAAWTGYRKKEIGSLTKRSFCLDSDPPTAAVEAAYSKRRREDTQVLHPELAARLRKWLDTKKHVGPGELLFPVSGKIPGGRERRTAKMGFFSYGISCPTLTSLMCMVKLRWLDEKQDLHEQREPGDAPGKALQPAGRGNDEGVPGMLVAVIGRQRLRHGIPPRARSDHENKLCCQWRLFPHASACPNCRGVPTPPVTLAPRAVGHRVAPCCVA